MKISTRLTVASLMLLLMVVVMSMGSFAIYRMGKATQEKSQSVMEIMNDISELNNLIYAYLLHQEERPRQQFFIKYDNLTAIVSELRFEKAEAQSLHRVILKDVGYIKEVFLKLVELHEAAPDFGKTALAEDLEERLTGQLRTYTRELFSVTTQLTNQIFRTTAVAQNRTNILIILISSSIAILLLAFAIGFLRRITFAILNLHQGTKVIASGNLDYKVGTLQQDEIGNLSRAFDHMTEQLKKITVSRDELLNEIKERKKVEEERKLLIANLETSNRELEAFSYSVSHDLRTPLRAIAGFSSLLRDHTGQLDDTALNYLQRIDAGVETMYNLIDDMLRLSRISRQEMIMEEIDLSAMGKDVIYELEQQHRQRHVETFIANGLKARGDARLINILLSNLLGNAFKYTGKTKEARVEFGNCRKKEKNVFFIRDNGVGFPMNQADRLFQPFQRLHGESDFPGTGIGLPIVQRVISRHGGEIWAEGEVGKGAVFYFTLE